jgi:hypothetical protein
VIGGYCGKGYREKLEKRKIKILTLCIKNISQRLHFSVRARKFVYSA